MADYSATVTTPLKQAERVSRSLGVYAGKVNVDNYNTTLLEITAITRYFKTGGVSGFTGGIVAVVADGLSDNGHALRWDYTTGAFQAYKPTSVVATTLGVVVDSDVSSGTIAVIYGSGESGLHATSGVGSLDVVQAAASGAGIEASTDDDVGEISFYAIGFM